MRSIARVPWKPLCFLGAGEFETRYFMSVVTLLRTALVGVRWCGFLVFVNGTRTSFEEEGGVRSDTVNAVHQASSQYVGAVSVDHVQQ